MCISTIWCYGTVYLCIRVARKIDGQIRCSGSRAMFSHVSRRPTLTSKSRIEENQESFIFLLEKSTPKADQVVRNYIEK